MEEQLLEAFLRLWSWVKSSSFRGLWQSRQKESSDDRMILRWYVTYHRDGEYWETDGFENPEDAIRAAMKETQ